MGPDYQAIGLENPGDRPTASHMADDFWAGVPIALPPAQLYFKRSDQGEVKTRARRPMYRGIQMNQKEPAVKLINM
uniref:Uncharacterized protein n=1 Tax=Romanomermis culicivorax TaxID=13658 RepID=A0A915KJ32_ROMCU